MEWGVEVHQQIFTSGEELVPIEGCLALKSPLNNDLSRAPETRYTQLFLAGGSFGVFYLFFLGIGCIFDTR